MAIHDCPHTFAELASEVLPRYMAALRQKLGAPIPAGEFCQPRRGYKTLLRTFSNGRDFPGCYVFVEQGRPRYVGISNTLLFRLRSHLTACNHHNSSLVYAIANRETPLTQYRRTTRDERYTTPFMAARDRLRACHVAYIHIDNPLVLYIFEAYAAMELDTYEWNSFVTH